MKFNHVGMSVSNLERTIAFYGDMFGLMPLCEIFPFGGDQYSAIMRIPDVSGRMCAIGRDSIQLELFEFAGSRAPAQERPVSDQGYSHFGVEVDDIEEAHERLRLAEVPIHSPVMTFNPSGMRALYCRDPDGNVVEVLQRPTN